MKTETIKNAKKVLEVFPTLKDLMLHDTMKKVLPPMVIMAFSNSQQWEGVSMAVNNMVNQMNGNPLYGNYCFIGNNEKGEVDLFDHSGDTIIIDSLTVFKAILVIIYCSYMSIELNDKQHNAYVDFYGQDTDVYRILN